MGHKGLGFPDLIRRWSSGLGLWSVLLNAARPVAAEIKFTLACLSPGHSGVASSRSSEGPYPEGPSTQ